MIGRRPVAGDGGDLAYFERSANVTCMGRIQVYLNTGELDALRKAAARSGHSVAELIRETIRKVVMKPQAEGPVAIWNAEPRVCRS